MLPWDRVFLPWSPQVFSLIPLKLLFGSYVWNSLWLCLITCNCVWLKPCTRICSYKSEWQRACAGKRKGQHTPLFLFFKKLNKCRSTPLGSSSTFISYTISITLQDRRTIPRVIYQLIMQPSERAERRKRWNYQQPWEKMNFKKFQGAEQHTWVVVVR